MLIDKNNLPLVAIEFMNQVHLEDVELINELYELILQVHKQPTPQNTAKLNEKYSQWFEHTINHFKKEEEKMLQLHFPPYPRHKGEHDRALALMETLYRQWNATNDINVLKDYFDKDLVPWLVQHIQTMDTVTAMFFKNTQSQ